jgi:hypothetical protein
MEHGGHTKRRQRKQRADVPDQVGYNSKTAAELRAPTN